MSDQTLTLSTVKQRYNGITLKQTNSRSIVEFKVDNALIQQTHATEMLLTLGCVISSSCVLFTY